MSEIIDIIAEDEGERLDKFLSSKIDYLSRSKIQELINGGKVSFNNKQEFISSASVKKGLYHVDLNGLKDKSSHLEAYDHPLEIVYEDDYLMVVNKPAGLTVHPGAGNYNKTLVNALIHYSKDGLSTIGGEFRPGIVHRLDKDTTGLLIIAKDDLTHQALSEALSEREIKRYYLALVYGRPELKAGTIKTFIAKDKFDHTKMVITKATGKSAVTHYRVLESFSSDKFSLIECKLDTGRTHQIRIHLDYKGFPLIGEPVYNSTRNKYTARLDEMHKKLISTFNRQALHAYKLEFIHPITEELINLEIDLPEDLEKLCQELKQF